MPCCLSMKTSKKAKADHYEHDAPDHIAENPPATCKICPLTLLNGSPNRNTSILRMLLCHPTRTTLMTMLVLPPLSLTLSCYHHKKIRLQKRSLLPQARSWQVN